MLIGKASYLRDYSIPSVLGVTEIALWPQVCPNFYNNNMAGEVKPAKDFLYRDTSPLLQLEELRVSNSQSVGEFLSNSSRKTVEQLNRGSVEDKSQERDGSDSLEAR